MLTSQHGKVLLSVAILALIALMNVAAAQQVAQPPARQPAFPPPVQAQGNQWTDHIIEQWLLVDNQGEIEVANFAFNRAHSKDVREFAKMMQQDHADVVDSLKQFHQRHAGAAAAAGSAPQGAPATQARQPGGFDVVAIKQELGKQCLATFKEEFSKIEGRQFDMCYMGHQVAAHLHMLDTLKVFKRHASPQLAELIGMSIETTEDHLEHARKMMKEFEGAAETARRPATEEKK